MFPFNGWRFHSFLTRLTIFLAQMLISCHIISCQQGFTADPNDENELWKLYVDWNGYADAPANRIGQLAAFIDVAHPKFCQEYINTDKKCWEEDCADDKADVATTQDAPYDTCPATYEIWASDQSNTVEGQSSLGVKGSFLWIFDSKSVNGQLQDGIGATSLPCTPGATEGPCDVMDIFPSTLVAANGSGKTLGDPDSKFGRLHGAIKVRSKSIWSVAYEINDTCTRLYNIVIFLTR